MKNIMSVLNHRSLEFFNDLIKKFRSHPMYVEYDFSVLTKFDLYMPEGMIGVNITKNSTFVNQILFIPDEKGDIGTVAIYGINLIEDMNTIKHSMTLFGLPVDNIESAPDMKFLVVTIGAY